MGLFSVALSFSALFFLVIVLIVFKSKKNISSTQLLIFQRMLVLTIIGLSIDIVGYTSFQIILYPDFIMYFISYGALVLPIIFYF